MNNFRRLCPYFSDKKGRPDESVIDRSLKPGYVRDIKILKISFFLNVGDRTRGNENDSSSLFGDDMTHHILNSLLIINMTQNA